MNVINKATNVAESIVTKVTEASPFGKFERITAGFCMAIPFFLLVCDQARDRNTPWLLAIPVGITLLPLCIPFIMRTRNGGNHGMIITLSGSLLLFALYHLFTNVYEFESRPSISAYVQMDSAYIFGMVLAIAAMLFIANGVVYWNKQRTFLEGRWRSLLNVVLGFLLLGVITFPCTTMYTTHMIFAITFFLGCAVGTLGRGTSPEKRVQHRFFDFAPVVVMGLAMLAHFGQEFGWFSGWPYSLVNLFGAESIALWITGLDFILVSLKRELNPNAASTNGGKESLVSST
jgi:hypothetical protein